MNEPIPLLRAPAKPAAHLKLCYRCHKRMSTIAWAGMPSEFDAHELECLRRCVESDARNRAMREAS